MKLRLLFILLLSLALPALAEDMPVAVDVPIEDNAAIEDAAVIRRVQQRLIDMGILEGEADGIAGSKTSEALRRFQFASGLDVTGTVDPATVIALDQAAPEDVPELKARLIELGYLSGKADDKWDTRAISALTQFQAVQGLKATGSVDEETLERLFSDDVVTVPEGIDSGSEGDDVKALQERLIRYAFMVGSADGIYGEATTKAVTAFQDHLIRQGIGQRYGVEETGEASPVTLLVLLDDTYSTFLHEVSLNENDAEALRVERRLAALGYMDAEPDNELDDYALEALKLFRERAGITGGNWVKKTDIDALFAEDAPTAELCVPHALAMGDSGLLVREVQKALAVGGLTIKFPSDVYDTETKKSLERYRQYLKRAEDPNEALFEKSTEISREAVELLIGSVPGYVKDVGNGSGGQFDIYRVQCRLNQLFYLDKSIIDGSFGSKTREAVKRFQVTNGLEETGIADEATQKLLFSEDAREKRFPYRVEVSLARQEVQVYESDGEVGEYELTHTFTCSTGLNNSTPRGVFLNGFPVNRWHYFAYFDCWAQYSYDIEGNIMFHSVIYSSNNEDSLRESSVDNLGSPASHGCIRLEVEDAKFLFENCKKGTVVIAIR